MQIVRVYAFELGEQVLGHFAQHVDQHVEAPAVRHADDDLLHPLAAATLDQFVHAGDEALPALERKALLPDITGMQVLLQRLRCGEPVQHMLFGLGRERGHGADRLEALLQPAFLRRVADVHVLDPDRAAVGLAQALDDLAQGHALLAEIQARGIELRVHVGFVQVVERRLELRNLRALLAFERIELSPARAEDAVGGDQLLHINLLARDGQIGLGRGRPQRALLGAQGEGFDDRRMRHIARFGLLARPGQELHLVEVFPPLLRHRTRIIEVGLVQILYVRCIAAEKVGIALEIFQHRGGSRRR